MNSKNMSPYEGLGEQIAIGSVVYNQILEHYYREALLLDNIRLSDWAAMLAEDLVYTVPMRQTRGAENNARSVIRSVMHMDEDYGSIMLRVMRLGGKSAWAENPPSRIRRFVNNVQVFATDKDDEFDVINYLLVTRNRFDDDFFDLIPCERHDRLRKVQDEYKLVRREALIDQALLGTPNLQIFL